MQRRQGRRRVVVEPATEGAAMPKGRLYTEAEHWAILRADRPRKAHIEDCAAVLGRSVAAVRRRGQRLWASRAHFGRIDAGSRDKGGGGVAGDASAGR